MLKYELRAYAYGTYDHLLCAKAKKSFGSRTIYQYAKKKKQKKCHEAPFT